MRRFRFIGVTEIAAGGEFDAAFNEFVEDGRAVFDYYADGFFVAQSGTGIEGIDDMFVKSIISISYTSDTALSAFCIADICFSFGNDGDGAA